MPCRGVLIVCVCVCVRVITLNWYFYPDTVVTQHIQIMYWLFPSMIERYKVTWSQART